MRVTLFAIESKLNQTNSDYQNLVPISINLIKSNMHLLNRNEREAELSYV